MSKSIQWVQLSDGALHLEILCLTHRAESLDWALHCIDQGSHTDNKLNQEKCFIWAFLLTKRSQAEQV